MLERHPATGQRRAATDAAFTRECLGLARTVEQEQLGARFVIGLEHHAPVTQVTPVHGRVIPIAQPLGMRAGRALHAHQPHAVGVELRIVRHAVQQVLAVRRIARAHVVGGVAFGHALDGAPRDRNGVDTGRDQRSGAVERDAGERDLAAIGTDVVLAGRVHPVEPQRTVRREIPDHIAAEVVDEQVHHFARREPAIPVAIKALLGDVRLDGIVGATLQLHGRRLVCQVTLQEHGAEHDARAIGQPLRIEHTQWQFGESACLTAIERHEHQLRTAGGVLAREHEPIAGGRHARFRRRRIGRGDGARRTARRGHLVELRARFVLLDVPARHRHHHGIAVGERGGRAHAWLRPQVLGLERASATASGVDGGHGGQGGDGRHGRALRGRMQRSA